MKEFEKLKAEYDATPIPQELNDRIQRECGRAAAAASFGSAAALWGRRPPVWWWRWAY